MEKLTYEIFNSRILEAGSICILGHVSPDGDCIGSTLAVRNYILNMKKDAAVCSYLEEINEKFVFLKDSDKISSDSGDGRAYDLAIVCDCADIKRIGRFDKYLNHAKMSLVIDHHYTNAGFGDYCIVNGDASSTCEVLYGLLDKKYIDKSISECIYTGIVHDSGVFKYSNTSSHTLKIAGECLDMGIDFGKIIEESFYSMSFDQKRVLGTVLSGIKQRAGGKIIYSSIDMETRKSLHAEDMDMDGMIDQLRTTSGAVIAAYMYETKDRRCKVSLRSNSDLVDVSRVCSANGGGGHKKAAGCFMSLDFEKNMDEIEADFNEQLKNADSL